MRRRRHRVRDELTERDLERLFEFVARTASRMGEQVPILVLGADGPGTLATLAQRFDGPGQVCVVDEPAALDALAPLAPALTRQVASLNEPISATDLARASGGIVVCARALDRVASPRQLLDNLAACAEVADLVVAASGDPDRFRGRRWRDALHGAVAPGRSAVVALDGRIARRPHGRPASVLAVTTCFNEADIIEQTVTHLLGQGANVHVVDNWSTDGSYELLVALAKQNRRISIERWPESGPLSTFELRLLLHRVEQLAAAATHYEWVLHNDADEFRSTPWPGVTLSEALGAVDAAGYTTVDFTLLDFRPTRAGFGRGVDPLRFFSSCELGVLEGYTHQIRAWRQRPGQGTLLVPSGGHDPLFEGRRPFPFNFIVRHYSLRSPEHARTKLERDRIPRLQPEEVAMGWHAHLREIDSTRGYLWSTDELLAVGDDFVPEHLLALLARVPEP